MLSFCRFFVFIGLTTFAISHADTIVWSGKVDANGTPTKSVKLELGQTYKIKVSGTMNLGKWWQQGIPLNEDACYEFNSKVSPQHLKSFKNSQDISVCGGHYREDHIYQSEEFKAVQSGIHFWIYDTNYEDNNGELKVEVIKVDHSSLEK